MKAKLTNERERIAFEIMAPGDVFLDGVQVVNVKCGDGLAVTLETGTRWKPAPGASFSIVIGTFVEDYADS